MLEFKLRCWDERGVVGRRAELASCRVQLGAPYNSALPAGRRFVVRATHHRDFDSFCVVVASALA